MRHNAPERGADHPAADVAPRDRGQGPAATPPTPAAARAERGEAREDVRGAVPEREQRDSRGGRRQLERVCEPSHDGAESLLARLSEEVERGDDDGEEEDGEKDGERSRKHASRKHRGRKHKKAEREKKRRKKKKSHSRR